MSNSPDRSKYLIALIVGISLFGLLALPAFAQTPAPTETATPAPTATRTYPDYVGDEGFRSRFLNDFGLPLLIIVSVGLVYGAWVLAPYLKRVNERRESHAKTTVDRVLDGDVLDAVTRAYLEKFETEYSRFSFRGLEDISVKKQPDLNTAFISLRLAERFEKDLARLGHKGDDPEAMREGSREVELSEAVSQSSRLAIVGAAGSGKSTLLQWAGVTVARNTLRAGKDLTPTQRQWIETLHNPKLLPIFVTLRDYVRVCREAKQLINPASLIEFITNSYARKFTSITFPLDFFKNYLRQGSLLLFDGVDEVPPDLRVAVRNAVEGLVNDYGIQHNYYLLTSRSVAYRGAVEFAEFEQLEAQPLSREQRDDLLRFWCDAIYPEDDAPREAANLSASIDRSDERVRRLARTPLMVAIFILVYYYSQRRLPNQRAEFYYRAARVLVSEAHHDATPDYPNWETLSVETRIDYLKRVAYELYSRNAQNAATADELAEWIKDESGFEGTKEKAKDFLTAAANRSGLLEERGGQYGFFTHKTFHEFLTGLYLAQNKRKAWPTLLAQRIGGADQDQWQEVILLAAGSLAYLNAPDANDFVETLAGLGNDSQDPLRLAGLERAALAQADFPNDRAQKNRKDLIARLEVLMVDLNLTPAQRRPLGLALSALGDPRFTKPTSEDPRAPKSLS